jgi:hypothetical protein
MTNKVGSMGEWTKESDVEVIAAFFGGEVIAWDDAMPSICGCGVVSWIYLGSHCVAVKE